MMPHYNAAGTLLEELTVLEVFVRYRPRFRHVGHRHFARVCRAAILGGAPEGTGLDRLASIIRDLWVEECADQPAAASNSAPSANVAAKPARPAFDHAVAHRLKTMRRQTGRRS
jgi:hypothetical protein